MKYMQLKKIQQVLYKRYGAVISIDEIERLCVSLLYKGIINDTVTLDGVKPSELG